MEETHHIQQNSVKLIKNSKGYNWEIKLHFNHKDVNSDTTVKAIAYLDDLLKKQFEQVK